MARAACRIKAFLLLSISFIERRPVAAWVELCACREISWRLRRASPEPSLPACEQRGERAAEPAAVPAGRPAILRGDGDIWLRCDCVRQAWKQKSDRPGYWPRNTNSLFSPDPERRAARPHRDYRWGRAAGRHERRCCTARG